MAEHNYLTAYELAYIRNYVSPVARKRFDFVLNDLDAMRAELARLHKTLDEIRHIALTTSTTDPAILRAIALIESTAAKVSQ